MATPTDWRQVEWWELGKLKPYPHNSKSHPPEQVQGLAKAIQKFGWDVPIVVDEDGTILKGHGRRLAAMELGLATVPVIVRSGLSETEKQAIRIADNKWAESDWVDDLLAAELRSLDSVDFDLDLTGFKGEELDALLAVEVEQESGDTTAQRNKLIQKAAHIRPVLYVEQVAVFEQALKATGNPNRGEALLEVCQAYLDGRRQTEG